MVLPGCCEQSAHACTPNLRLRFHDWYNEDEEKGMEILKGLGPIWRVGLGVDIGHPSLSMAMHRDMNFLDKLEASHCPFCGTPLPEARLRDPALPDWLAYKPWTADHRGTYQTDRRFNHLLMFELVTPSKQPNRGLWGELLNDMDMLERILDCLPGERRDQMQVAAILSDNHVGYEEHPEKLLEITQQLGPHDIENQWRKDNGKSEYAPVSNKVVEQYLRDNGARSFTGRGWADDLAISLCGLVRRWGKHYNKNLFKAE